MVIKQWEPAKRAAELPHPRAIARVRGLKFFQHTFPRVSLAKPRSTLGYML